MDMELTFLKKNELLHKKSIFLRIYHCIVFFIFPLILFLLIQKSGNIENSIYYYIVAGLFLVSPILFLLQIISFLLSFKIYLIEDELSIIRRNEIIKIYKSKKNNINYLNIFKLACLQTNESKFYLSFFNLKYETLLKSLVYEFRE